MLVPVPGIKEAALCNPKPLLLRPYGWPFLALYPAFFYIYFFKYDEYLGQSEWTMVFLGAIISLQALLWLMPFWNVSVRESFETEPASNVESASQIKIVPAENAGSPDVCDILRDADGTVSFVFQKRRYIYDPEKEVFEPPKFPVDDPTITVGQLQKAKGLMAKDIEALERTYGPNKFDIPVPTFTELWKEHAVAPFFVFQVFCIALWFLDEMWRYSLFSLFMLFTFESTVVWQRQRTMTEFRGMGIKPYNLYVYRQNKWVEIETTALLPGDIVSITRTPEDSGLPCDLLLLHGSAIVNEAMLSGESTPLLKESTETREASDVLDLEGIDKNSMLFGGTKVLQVTTAAHGSIPPPPDQGALAIAIRTGFETSQGSLVRVMIFSTERVGVGNKEAYLFILFLLVFAIAASAYVWHEGVKADRKRSKLLLDAVLIITSVVPPELPMELTLAVNTSLAALSKVYVYCTEPFRIPFAGRVDVCCFDKTGTLTAEDLIVEGVTGLKEDSDELMAKSELPDASVHTLAAAHALVHLDDGEIAGDPMEKNTLSWLGWEVLPNDRVRCVGNPKLSLHIIKRFQFSSALKRSSSVARIGDQLLVAVKGAPETIQRMLVKVPANYEATYKHYTREGSRVLALGYKHLPVSAEREIYHYPRDDAESKLEFAGFLVFSCPLKDDAIESVRMLNESSHRVMMITGDNPLTAIKVASDVGIVERQTLILDKPEHSDALLSWQSVDGETEIPCNVDEPIEYRELFLTYDLCVSGYAMSLLQNSSHISDLIRHTWVYARVSPAQKEFILITLKKEGYMTLMCGDGTNDVGALKQAHLGVALLNGTEDSLKKIAEKSRIDMMKNMYEKQVEMMSRWNAGKVPPVPIGIAHLYPPGPNNPHYIKAVEKNGGTVDDKTRQEIAALQFAPATSEAKAADLADKLTAMMGDENDGEAPVLKLGDASIAAPLTSKLANVSAVTAIIRQGRCTLVATIQMYKILALNCLIAAYSLSVLYLAGIKFGDVQSTVSGLLLSVCFMSISRARAVDKLSKERPQPGIFNKYIMGSILGQFAVHIVTLIYVSNVVYSIEPREINVDLQKTFTPSLLNTAIYLLQLVQQISTFAVNYQGKPFREALHENKGMYYGIVGVLALAFAGATEFVPEMNEALSLVKMTPYFKFVLTSTMLFDFAACFAIEYGLKYLYSDYKPSDIALRLDERKELVQLRK